VTDNRRQRAWLLGASAVVAVAIVAFAIAIGRAGHGGVGNTTGTPEGIAATRALFAGIRQRGAELGSASAAVTVTEFADLQCPFCGESARSELPKIVPRYVRAGRVRLVFRNLAFLGKDSLAAARMAAAAALQNRLWQFVDLVYRNQGEENSGWVTDAYLRRVAAAAGLDVRRAFAERDSSAATRLLAGWQAVAKGAHVTETPTFVLSRGGREVRRMVGAGGDLGAAIDEALRGP
jgi:protein-disulfide isomerase